MVIETALRDRVDELAVSFDDQNGYPRRSLIDSRGGVADDEVSFEVDLVPLS